MKITNLRDLTQQQVSHNPEISKKVMLSHGDIPHLTNFSQATFAPGTGGFLSCTSGHARGIPGQYGKRYYAN